MLFMLFCVGTLLPTHLWGIGSFTYNDSVSILSIDSSNDGIIVNANRSFLKSTPDRYAMPYRSYAVALENAAQQLSVSLQVHSSEIRENVAPRRFKHTDGVGSESQGVVVETGGTCRGTPIALIQVPLAQYNSQSKSFTITKKFSLSIQSRGGLTPVVAPLCNTINGRKQKGALRGRPLFKKQHTSLGSIALLASFTIGDRELHTQKEDGYYGLSYIQIEKALLQKGLSLSGINVDQLVLLTGTADTLTHAVPQEVIQPSLTEVPLSVVDYGADGVANGAFDRYDSLYFFGHGSGIWKSIATEHAEYSGLAVKRFFSHSPYSWHHTYYLGYKKQGSTERLASKRLSMSGAPVNEGLTYRRVEKDSRLWDGYFSDSNEMKLDRESGKEWFWKWFKPKVIDSLMNQQLLDESIKKLPDLIPGQTAYIGVSFQPMRSKSGTGKFDRSTLSMAERLFNISFTFRVNKEEVTSIGNAIPITGNTQWFQTDALENEYNFYRLIVNNSAIDDHGQRFDGYSLAYPSQLMYQSGGRYIDPTLTPGANTVNLVGDTSDLYALRIESHEAVSLHAVPNGSFTDTLSNPEEVRYYLFKPSDVRSVDSIVPILSPPFVSQDITTIPGAEYLIITPEAFQAQAWSLKQFRESGRAGYSITTEVVTAEDIYRMYSSGRVSPVALRDYIRYYLTKHPQLTHVLLFGDGHYDYRNLNGTNRVNPLPPYEIESVAAEDFFTVLDAGEECPFGEYLRDLYVGRVPVETEADASAYITKIVEYEDGAQKDNGPWRNRALFVSDDFYQYKNDSIQQHDGIQNHDVQSNNLYEAVRALQPARNTEHFFLHDYMRNYSRVTPVASKNLTRLLNDGQLYTTFYGHGGTVGWSDEELLRSRELGKLYNRKKLTILGSFSCTVGRFEDGKGNVLGERFVRDPGKGAIASIGALRESYSNRNGVFGQLVTEAVFDTTRTVTLGEALHVAKISENNHSGDRFNDLKYLLLGEPVLRVPSPSLSIQNFTTPDTLMGLDSITLSGSLSGYSRGGNGMVSLTLHEADTTKALEIEWIDNDDDFDDYSDTRNEHDQMNGRLLYSELVPLVAGQFSTTFLSPSDIREGEQAKLRAYFWEEGSGRSGWHYSESIVLGKRSPFADSISDTQAPDIVASNCVDADYSEHYLSSTITIALNGCIQIMVSDSLALDFTSSEGRGIFYSADTVWNNLRPIYLEQRSKKAVFRLEFTDKLFEPGTMPLKITATDLLGNKTVREYTIELTGTLTSGLIDLYSVPNPLKSSTTFYFKSMNSDFYRASIKIYNQRGKLVKMIPQAYSGRTTWDGRDEWGNYLANGVYFYKVFYSVPRDDGNAEYSKIQKLVISR
ncbi:MAG: C25 family cysteine peptidase [Fibrobacterales bacterium]